MAAHGICECIDGIQNVVLITRLRLPLMMSSPVEMSFALMVIDRRGDFPVTEAEWLAHRGAAVKAISYSWKPVEILRAILSRGDSA